MKQRERTAAVTVVVVLLTVGGAMSQVLGPDAMVKGIEFTRASSLKPYNISEAYQSLKLLQTTGANWVTIVPVYWMSDTGAPTVFWMDDQSPSDDEVRQAVRWAKQLSLKVFMKPEVHCVSGVWQGYHNPHGNLWFQSYWFFIQRYARIAQQEGCEMFCVGSELDRTADTTWERVWWSDIINWTKGEYLGPITYAADWRTYRNIPFWDSLDLVGINAYFPMWTDAEPSPPPPSWPVGYMSWMWDGCVRGIESLRVTLADTLKPIMFTEIGYRSIVGCSHEPGNDTISATYDSTEQRNCYIAAFHSLLGKPWFAGWFWHEWTSDTSQGGPGDLSYSPKGKLAQEVLRRWFAAIGSQRGITFMSPQGHSDLYEWPRTQASLESLSSTGAQWVTIVPNGWMADTGADYGFIRVIDTTAYPASPSDHALHNVIDSARQHGLRVVLKPEVDCTNGIYRGDMDPNGSQVCDQWFDDYLPFIVRYAQMAEAENCEMFHIGVELNKAVDDEEEMERWRDLIIPAVREVYSGPISYAALWTFMSDDPNRYTIASGLWDDLDLAGINAYFQLFPSDQYPGKYPRDTMSGQTPSVADLIGENLFPPDTMAWGGRGNPGKWVPRLESLYDTIQKPIVFPEIGYRSIDSTAFHTSDARPAGWVAQTSSTSRNLYSVCFPVDTMTGYVVGDEGTILKTTTSGDTWVACNSGTSLALHSVDFPAPDTGYAVGNNGTILKTANGWSSYEDKAELGVNVPYYSVSFPETPSYGFVVGAYGTILKTTNGGNSWTRLYCVDAGDTVRVTLRSISFVRPDGPLPMVGYIVGDSGTVLKSTDAGLSWEALSKPVTVNLNAVSLVSPDTCFAAGDSGHLIRTTNGGESWADSVAGGTNDLHAVSVPDYHSARFVLGTGGAIMRAGDDWPFAGSRQRVPSGADFRGVQFQTFRHGAGDSIYYEYVGFAVGNEGAILKASHGGRMVIDFNEQAICYEAAFRAFWGDRSHPSPLPWFYGFHWWNWDLDPEPMVVWHETRIAEMPPQQKPAEDTLRGWYDWGELLPQDTLAWMTRHYPTGSLDVVVPPDGKVNEPLVLCRLESHNWEEGGSADSARLLQEYYGLGDTLLAADTTAWFRFVEDTTCRFLHGQGRYRLYAQYLDVPDKLSPPYPDFVDSVLVFDTTAATGNSAIDKNDGGLTSGCQGLGWCREEVNADAVGDGITGAGGAGGLVLRQARHESEAADQQAILS